MATTHSEAFATLVQARKQFIEVYEVSVFEQAIFGSSGLEMNSGNLEIIRQVAKELPTGKNVGEHAHAALVLATSKLVRRMA